MATPAHSKAPPKARLAFRVGIVGHRPHRLPKDRTAQEQLRETLGFILSQVKAAVEAYAGTGPARQWYGHEKPLLRAASPLAEGCDRLFAEEAISRAYQILCPMPFHQPEFEKDFAPEKAEEPESEARFRNLLAQAERAAGVVKFELDGDRAHEAEAYRAAGRIVLNQSDLLIAVWDGKPAAGEGGTAETMREAVRFHVPVIWIDPFAPRQWQALCSADDLRSIRDEVCCRPLSPGYSTDEERHAHLSETIDELVLGQIAWTEDQHLARYFREQKPRIGGGVAWKLFRAIAGGELPGWPFAAMRDFVEQVRREWPVSSDAHLAHAPSKVEDWANRELRSHFAWADKLADIYADRYRSAYIEIYVFSVIAVALALLPLSTGGLSPAAPIHLGLNEIAYIAAESAALLWIVLRFANEHRRKWHERWMEYRLLAEMIRQLRLLIPLGGGCPFPNVPIVSAAWGSPTQSWMYWQMRSIARSVGLPPAKVTTEHLRQCLQFMGGVTSGQLQFHAATAKRSGRIAHVLHRGAFLLFLGTVLAVAAHAAIDSGLIFRTNGEERLWSARFASLAIVLPVIGSALLAIWNQGEFARVAKRSAAMADLFHKFSVEIAVLRSDRVDARLSDAAALAGRIAAAMIDEVADWRVVFTERPVTI